MTAFKPGQSPPPVRIPIRLATHAEGGNRTHTGLAAHRILSPARLPVPPLRLGSKSIGALPETWSGSARPRSCRRTNRRGSTRRGPRGNHGFTRAAHTGPRGPPDFESGASASSATSARHKSNRALPQTFAGWARPRSWPASRPFSERKEWAHGGNPVSPVLLKVAAIDRCPDTCPHEAGSGCPPEPVRKRDIRATEEEES